MEGVRPRQVNDLIKEALSWGCFFGVEVIFLLAERINQSEWTKRSAWEDRDIKRRTYTELQSITLTNELDQEEEEDDKEHGDKEELVSGSTRTHPQQPR